MNSLFRTTVPVNIIYILFYYNSTLKVVLHIHVRHKKIFEEIFETDQLSYAYGLPIIYDKIQGVYK